MCYRPDVSKSFEQIHGKQTFKLYKRLYKITWNSIFSGNYGRKLTNALDEKKLYLLDKERPSDAISYVRTKLIAYGFP